MKSTKPGFFSFGSKYGIKEPESSTEYKAIKVKSDKFIVD